MSCRILDRYLAGCMEVVDQCQRECFTEHHGERQQALIDLSLVLDCIERAAYAYADDADIIPDITRLSTADWPRMLGAIDHPMRGHDVNRKHRSTLHNNLLAALQCMQIFYSAWVRLNLPDHKLEREIDLILKVVKALV